MKFRQLPPLAVDFLRRNKVRASLTALGIVIGISSVVALVSAGSAAQQSITNQIQSLGPDLVFILPGAPLRRRGFRDGPPAIARAGQLGNRSRTFEVAMRPRAARMHDALGDAFVVEMEDLLAENEILEQRRATGTQAQAVLVVRNPRAVVGCKVFSGRGTARCHLLVGFAAASR